MDEMPDDIIEPAESEDENMGGRESFLGVPTNGDTDKLEESVDFKEYNMVPKVGGGNLPRTPDAEQTDVAPRIEMKQAIKKP